jgi:hypothetical protein
MPKVKITWNGKGGELDSRMVDGDDGEKIRDKLVEMLEYGIVSPGDTITIEEVE